MKDEPSLQRRQVRTLPSNQWWNKWVEDLSWSCKILVNYLDPVANNWSAFGEPPAVLIVMLTSTLRLSHCPISPSTTNFFSFLFLFFVNLTTSMCMHLHLQINDEQLASSIESISLFSASQSSCVVIFASIYVITKVKYAVASGLSFFLSFFSYFCFISPFVSTHFRNHFIEKKKKKTV